MSTPDIRVRLSPEGLKEVLFALRTLQTEGQKTNKAAAQSFGVVKSALADLKSLLPTLGLAATVAGFASLAKQAVNTADQTGKLQQKVGGTVEEISALTLAFRTNESNQDGLQTALLKTTQVIGAVESGSTETAEALRAIGVDANALTKLSTPRALESIAQGLAKIPDEAERAAAAQKIFGKQSGDLLIALNAVGRDGIDPFIEKARQLGVLIDSDLAEAAARANDALGIIKIQAEGLATQFTAGLAPQIAGAMEDFSAAITGDGFNAMRKFAELVGFSVRFIVGEFIVLGKIIGANVAAIGVLLDATGNAVAAAARLDFSSAKKSFTDAFKTLSSMSEQLEIEKAEIRERVATPQEARAPAAQRAVVRTDNLDESNKKVQAARLAAAKAALAAEVKLQQEGLRAADAENKTAYDQGLISLQAYFDKRAEIVARGTEIEVQALKAERAAVAQSLASLAGTKGPEAEAERIKVRQQLATLTADIQAKERAGERELAAIEAERTAARKQVATEENASLSKLAELEGRRHEAFQRNLAAEIQQLRELGARAGQTAEDIDAQVQRLVSARTAAFNLDEVSRQAESAMAAFTRDSEQVQRDQQAGIITQLEGEQRLIEIERARLPVLQQLAQQMLIAAQATGSDEQIQKAQEFAASVDQIAVSFQQATDVGSMFRTGAVEAFQDGIQTLLTNASEIESVGDAFKSLALSVVQSLNRIAAEILAKQAILALLKAFGGAGASAGSAAAAAKDGGYIRGYRRGGRVQRRALALPGYVMGGPIGASGPGRPAAGLSDDQGYLFARRVRAFAGGGDVRGPRLRIAGPDKIPILAQEGEFMMAKRRVQEPGALDFLRAWNTGRVTLRQALSVPRFATGGAIGTPQGTPAGAGSAAAATTDNLRIVNVLDPEIINDALGSASGERSIVNVIRKNSTAIRRLLGS